jgi:hypothetical protein
MPTAPLKQKGWKYMIVYSAEYEYATGPFDDREQIADYFKKYPAAKLDARIVRMLPPEANLDVGELEETG